MSEEQKKDIQIQNKSNFIHQERTSPDLPVSYILSAMRRLRKSRHDIEKEANKNKQKNNQPSISLQQMAASKALEDSLHASTAQAKPLSYREQLAAREAIYKAERVNEKQPTVTRVEGYQAERNEAEKPLSYKERLAAREASYTAEREAEAKRPDRSFNQPIHGFER